MKPQPLTLLALTLAAVTAIAADQPSRPNILFIYTDDQSQRTLGCYREEGAWPWVRTPNIDRLAAEGVRFTTAYGASWCSPSRACVMTGRLPHGIHGVHLKGVTAKGEAYDPIHRTVLACRAAKIRLPDRAHRQVAHRSECRAWRSLGSLRRVGSKCHQGRLV
ncbi:MAG: sulfatase-like hydrolase/transferase [Prosthecobacter sp.]|nr:sulfatase-like hydrolase/transferase [Prosthecobacter sp.]